jgi:hypothetical protein
MLTRRRYTARRGTPTAETRGETLGDPPWRRRPVAGILARVDGVSELNKRTVRLFVQAVWNEGRLEVIDELLAADYAGHVSGLPGCVRGPEGMRRLVASRRHAHPDLYIKIEDQIAEDDRVVCRWRATAGSPAIDRPEPAPRCCGVSIIRLLAGRQVDCHTVCTSPRRPPAGDTDAPMSRGAGELPAP